MKNLLKLALILITLISISCEKEAVFNDQNSIEEEFDADAFLRWLDGDKTATTSAATADAVRRKFAVKTRLQHKKRLGPKRKYVASPVLVKYLREHGLKNPPKGYVYVFLNNNSRNQYISNCDKKWSEWRSRMYKNCDSRWKKNKNERRKCRVWAGDHYKWARNRYCRK